MVKNPKVNGIYHAWNSDLKIDSNSKGHLVIVLSVNKRKNTSRVKTITSIERYNKISNKFFVPDKTLDDLKKGLLLPIPIKQLRTKNYSGISHKIITISNDKLNYDRFNFVKYPKRYEKLILRK